MCLPVAANLGEQTKTTNAASANVAKRTSTTSGLEDMSAVPIAVESASAVESVVADRALDQENLLVFRAIFVYQQTLHGSH